MQACFHTAHTVCLRNTVDALTSSVSESGTCSGNDEFNPLPDRAVASSTFPKDEESLGIASLKVLGVMSRERGDGLRAWFDLNESTVRSDLGDDGTDVRVSARVLAAIAVRKWRWTL
eukprot:CAMPEP_0114254296 /NCGR_PEP_ID=MMETSP0058-20121206/16901_1 /TAXON_ID=36894 /ORGANISM="Pyramimonas parkeae, CCMP726" /LENGTH=116 /DNA_ID=CAMNT_0001368501 /DNA_START=461 /DNA_END=811 /DNA_ORIENTATION=-